MKYEKIIFNIICIMKKSEILALKHRKVQQGSEKRIYDKVIWSLDALFHEPFKFKSSQKIWIVGHDNFCNYMAGGVIFIEDKIVSRCLSRIGRDCDFLIMRHNIRKLKNDKLVAYLDGKDITLEGYRALIKKC